MSIDERSPARAGMLDHPTRWYAGALVVVTLAAFVLRARALLTHFDVPGDGPLRASVALAWGRSPGLPTCGIWPPGHTIVAGMWSWLVPTPLWSARLLNLTVGTLTVPALSAVAVTTWSRGVALGAASALAVLPLHVELSASSLTEPLFLFTVLVGWWLLAANVGAATTRRRVGLLAGGISLMTAEATRYEAWLLGGVMLVWAVRYVPRRREWLLFAALIVAFPLVWTLVNAGCGNALVGPSAALREPGSGSGYDPARAARHLAALGGNELGYGLLTLAALGIAQHVVAGFWRSLPPRRWLALAVVGATWVFLEWFTMQRGPSAWNRYALAGLVLLLPFAIVPLRLLSRGVVATAIAMVVGATAIAAPAVLHTPVHRWIRTETPEVAAAIAAWLRADPARAGMPIISTVMGWELTFLPLHEPSTYGRSLIISDWMDEAEIATLATELRRRGSFVLITGRSDESDLARLEKAAGVSLRATPPTYSTVTFDVRLVQLPPAP